MIADTASRTGRRAPEKSGRAVLSMDTHQEDAVWRQQ